MDSVLRRFGLKKGDQRDGRQAAPKDLFAYSECVQYGFPYKPSSIAFHPHLKLLAIGTHTGSLRIYGAPGVQLISVHKDEVAVLKIFFSGQANIITLCADNSLHLWEIGTREQRSCIQEIRSLSLERVFSGASSTCMSLPSGRLFLGTDSGHVYMLDLKNFKLLDQVIFQENVVQNAPEEFRRNPGAVESIVVHPLKPDKVLIGYNRGLIVLYNIKQKKTEQFYNAGQELECLFFHRTGKEFMSAHINGSYIVWKLSETNRPKEQTTTPYGPFPCKAINKMEWKTVESDDTMVIFSGGMPRASYGDHHTVTVMQGDRHVVFDFTSKVIDFVTFSTADETLYTNSNASASYDDPSCLFVLLEEEMVVIDLESDGWPVFSAPYLATVHSTAITCTAHVSDVNGTFWNKLMEAGRRQLIGFSSREWPVCGGVNLRKDSMVRDILITGHEDGSVRFWDVSSVDIVLIYKLSTSNLFSLSSGNENSEDLDTDEEWPPFKKVGTYDPFSDDPRLGIQKIAVSALNATLILGGTAGQVIVMQLGSEDGQINLRRVDVNIVGERDNFVWKGHEALPLKTEARFPPGFQPLGVLQINPPAACTSLAFHPDWQVLAVGTSHGFGLVDYGQMQFLACKCTLSLTETSGLGESTMSRRKSFKKSLRESFRRLRSRRSERRPKTEVKEDDTRMNPITSPDGRQTKGALTSRHRQTHIGTTDVELSKPVERQVEARPAEDVSGSIVRALYFVETYLTSAQSHTPTFWAGTNAGYVYMYQLTVPPNERRSSQSIQTLLVKEIRLKHRAPVMSICVIDHSAIPFIAPREAHAEQAPEGELTGGAHSVVICSEEQLKVFSLPHLSAREKYKLTASEGSKIRKVSYVKFRSPAASNYFEYDLVCLTNLGEVQTFSLPQLRRVFKAECIRQENIIGIVSCIFNRSGDAFHLFSPSEFKRFSISTTASVYPVCSIPMGGGGGDDGSLSYTSSPDRSHSANTTRTRATTSQVSGDHLSDDDTGGHVSPADYSVRSGDTTEDSVRVHISGGSEELISPPSLTVSNSVITTTHLISTSIVQNTGNETFVSTTHHGTSSNRN